MDEKFAVYGFEVAIPDDWRIEFNAKNRRERGDVVFHTGKNNLFFVSWGDLANAQKSFDSLGQQRDKSVSRLKGNPNVSQMKMDDQGTLKVCGHDGLLTHVTAKGRKGFMAKAPTNQEVWSLHMHCPDSGKYYVLYMDIRDSAEFADQKGEFLARVGTFRCHHTGTG